MTLDRDQESLATTPAREPVIRELFTTTGHRDPVINAVLVSNGARLLTIDEGGTAKMWDLALPLTTPRQSHN